MMGIAIASPVLRATRPTFLSLTPVCVLIGIGAALQSHARISITDCVLVFIGALLAHISVNLLNEYDDFRSGLDSLTVRTPFSGGSGSLPLHPEAATATRMFGIITLLASGGIGLYFVIEKGVTLLPLGLIGLLLVIAYTPLLTRRPLLCLFAPGLGFGPLMIMGSSFALCGAYTWVAAAASLPPLLLVSELLLVNQFPDIDADRQVGRRHLPIVIGRKRSAILFGIMILASFGAIAICVGISILPRLAMLALLPLPVGLYLARQVYFQADNLPRLINYLGINVALIHVTLLLLALGLLFG
jgi:1,4-dihydroxy-2-naphthoate polyprenyltransferase